METFHPSIIYSILLMCNASKRVFNRIDHQIWQALWRWSLRRHPNKGKRWVADRYFKIIHGRKWNFAVTVADRRGVQKTLGLVRLSDMTVMSRSKALHLQMTLR